MCRLFHLPWVPASQHTNLAPRTTGAGLHFTHWPQQRIAHLRIVAELEQQGSQGPRFIGRGLHECSLKDALFCLRKAGLVSGRQTLLG